MQQLALSAFNVSPLLLSLASPALGSAAPPFNLVISNVPGSREPLYWNGARLDGNYPLSIALDGQAMNITCPTMPTTSTSAWWVPAQRAESAAASSAISRTRCPDSSEPSGPAVEGSGGAGSDAPPHPRGLRAGDLDLERLGHRLHGIGHVDTGGSSR